VTLWKIEIMAQLQPQYKGFGGAQGYKYPCFATTIVVALVLNFMQY
jgi:hypothetical protein